MAVEFTDAEIREELARLGYKDVPEEKLAEFKKDLMVLINSERSRNSSHNNSSSSEKAGPELGGYTHSNEKAGHVVRGYTHNNEKAGYEVGGYVPDTRDGSKLVPESFSNHGGQWLRNTYKENWHYESGGVSHPDKSKLAASSKTSHSEAAHNDDAGRQDRTSRHSAHVCSDSDTDLDLKFIKRKTSRKGTNGHRVVDESFSTTDTADSSGLYDIYERIRSLAMRDCECGKTRPSSADTEPPYRIKGINRNPSVLTSKSDPPHTRNLVRTKPFLRHQMYQRAWKMQPPIGEDNRQNVCREVHNKLLKKDEIKLSHKVFVPNTYIVPSEKPRYKLRWAVRRCNQNYEMPPCGFFHEA